MRGSETHQRIVKYSFAGLECVVRSEVDGYYPDLAASVDVDKKNGKGTGSNDDSADDLLSALTNTSVTPFA